MTIKHKTAVYNIKRVADEIEEHIGHKNLAWADEMDEQIWERTQHIWISVSLLTSFDMKDLRGIV